MTTKLTYSILIMLFLIVAGCSKDNKSSNEITVTDSSVTTVEIKEPVMSPAVCIWNKVSVREAPGNSAKWVTSLSIGESLQYANVDSIIGKKNYIKITLNDGKEGWARKDFIVVDAKPAVILSDTYLYSRPDLLTKTEKKISMMDIVASIEKQGDWLKIKGKRTEGKWIDEGWIKEGSISFDAVDIATAKFGKQALSIKDNDKKKAAINNIIENGDLSNSKFISDLVTILTELESEEPKMETSADSTSTN